MSKKRLLLVEDDPDVAELLITYLSVEGGYEVHHADLGEDGISMARAKFPNLIVLDVMLPDIDGFDVARSLRTTLLTRHIPIMFLTQRDRRSDKITGLELGADDYLGKPFDLTELLLRIQGSLHRSTREQLYDPNTGLPLRAIIEEDMPKLAKFTNCTTINIEIAGMRSFRDVYGFVAAGYLLEFFGLIITESLAKLGTVDDLAGMYTEDRYVIFTMTEHLNDLVTMIKTRFDEGSKAFYTFLDRERGHLLVYDPDGYMRHVPLMHLEIAFG
ncbi:MAG: response regulator [Anaerolineae bacterium]|nr:response regulator [Anaerolineae bacterium]